MGIRSSGRRFLSDKNAAHLVVNLFRFGIRSWFLMMASSSGEEYNLDRTYRNWLAETFDGQETADGEMEDSTTGDFCIALDPFEPTVGMEFGSAEEAREFYEMYGRRVGFTIRNNRTRRSVKDNSIIGREFVCSKEGFRAGKHMKKDTPVSPSGPVRREGCNAMLRIAAKGGGKWVVYGFMKEHSHELNPSKMPPRRSHRIAFNEDEKDLKIRELSTELHREKKKTAAYKEQLQIVLKYIEEHTQKLSLKAELAANKVREFE